jgi:hypothetical protein
MLTDFLGWAKRARPELLARAYSALGVSEGIRNGWCPDWLAEDDTDEIYADVA